MKRAALLAVGILLVFGACGDDDGGQNQSDAGANNNNQAGVCGDGELNSGEECDDGAANSDSSPDACRTDCRNPFCGDGVADSNEDCDDGDNGDDECPPTCVAPVCGDGHVWASQEACDDGNTVDGDDCSADCTQNLALCGNGTPDAGEACDDGAANSDTAPNACRTTCQFPTCGDGVTDDIQPFGEACDDGAANSDSAPNACRTTCDLPSCGDGVVDDTLSEVCDDGGIATDDGCDDGCAVETGWTCSGTPSTCQEICADGLVVGNEGCDDGNSNTGDGCDGSCVEEANWACTGEPSVCDAASCGDGVAVGSEACDDGNTTLWDGCNTCSIVEFRTTTYASNARGLSDVGGAGTNFVVVSGPAGFDGSSNGIAYQLFDDSAVPIGSEGQANTYTTGAQYHPSAARNSAGNFVVVWTSDGQDGSGLGIFGQRFDATGTPVGNEFSVNTFTTGDQDMPRVAMETTGEFVVVWESAGQDGSGKGVYGQRFLANGNLAGTEFRVNTYTTGDQDTPDVSYSGGFVVVWASDGQDGSGLGIYGQRYDATGSTVGSELHVSISTVGHQSAPVVVAALPEWAVFWTSQTTGGDIYGRRYLSGSGGGEILINTVTANPQITPTVSRNAVGDLMVFWAGIDAGNRGIFGQKVSMGSTLPPIGGEFAVNHYTTSEQQRPHAAMSSYGHIVVWESVNQNPADHAVYAQRYNLAGEARGVGAPLGP